MKPLFYSLTTAFRILCALAMLLCLNTGCVTGPDGQNQADIPRISRVTQEAAAFGTEEALLEHPEWMAHFQKAHTELAVLEKAETIDFLDVLEIVNRLPVSELESREARLAIRGARILISGIDLPIVSADRLTELRPIVKALRIGLEDGGVPPITQ